MRWTVKLAAVAIALATLSCATAQKDAKQPDPASDSTTVQCPYCKAVFRW